MRASASAAGMYLAISYETPDGRTKWEAEKIGKSIGIDPKTGEPYPNISRHHVYARNKQHALQQAIQQQERIKSSRHRGGKRIYR